MNRKPLDTDHAKLTRAVQRELWDQCDLDGDHLVFRAMGGRHFKVELYGGQQVIMSVRRLAYALQHPEDHVGVDEEVWTTCEHKGNHQNGDGTCLIHQRKVNRGEALLVRAHDTLSEKLQEATA